PAWILLAAAAWTLTRGSRDENSDGQPGRILSHLWRKPDAARSGHRKRKPELLEHNPILWLAGEEPALRKLVWLIVIGWGVFVGAIGLTSPKEPMNAYTGAKLGGFLFKALIAAQACS